MSFLEALVAVLFVLGVTFGVIVAVVIVNFLGTFIYEWLEERGVF